MSSSSQAIDSLTEPLTQFGSQLFSAVREKEKNVILSPISVHMALNLVLMGARNDSQTGKELVRVLGYASKPSDFGLQFHEAYATFMQVIQEMSQKSRAARSEGLYDIRVDKSQPALDIWNMLVAKNGEHFLQSYLDKVSNYYKGVAESIDDAKPESKTRLLDRVNKWGEEAGFEGPVLDPSELDEPFTALLMSAIQVEAFWSNDFSMQEKEISFYNYGKHDQPVRNGQVLCADNLKRAAFVEISGRQDEARWHSRRSDILNANEDKYKHLMSIGINFHAVKVPLRGGLDYVMVEPSYSSDGTQLDKLMSELLKEPTVEGQAYNLADLLDIIDSGEARATFGKLSFPPFKFESDIDLNEPLMRLGLSGIFDDKQCDLSEMMAGRCLYISKASHKAVVEANEFGLKAAAITKMTMFMTTSVQPPEFMPITLAIKNPFMFIIRYQHLPLFIGQLVHL